MLRVWASKTHWHGVSDCFASEKRGSKFLWLIVLTCSAFMFISGSFYHITDVLNGKTWTTATYQEEQTGGIKFPKIIVCDRNIVSKRRVESLNMSLGAAQYVAEQTMMQGPGSSDREQFDAYLEQHPERRNTSLIEWSDLLAPSCEPFIYTCNIGGGRTQEEFNCCKSMKSIPVVGNGRCFLLDLPQGIRDRHPQTEVGSFGSLTLFISNRISDYSSLVQRQEAGLLLYVGYDPRTSLYTTPLAVQPGSKNYVSMSVQETRINLQTVIIPHIYPLYSPTPECELNGQLKVLEGNYILESCLDDCSAQMDLKYCGCVRFEWAKPGVPMCDPIQWDNCHVLTPEMAGDTNWDEVVGCKNSCRNACSQFTVTLRQSATLYPIPAISPWLQHHMHKNHGHYFEMDEVGHFSLVEIFFESTTVSVVVTYERMPVETLVANIGGTLGVWAGISLITIYQALVYCFYAVYAAARGRTKEQKLNTKL